MEHLEVSEQVSEMVSKPVFANSPGVSAVRSPHQVTADFEAALCEYTGARYAVTTTSCTQALLMALVWFRMNWCADILVGGGGVRRDISMPRRSYVGVPASILNAGLAVSFRDEDWEGEYQLDPFPLWDSARRFTSGMFRPGAMQCVSFHWSKILGLSQGGAILHDDPIADSWLRRARFDGRSEGVPVQLDRIQYPSWHCYLSPEVAAQGLMKLALLPRHNQDLPRSEYPDLSLLEAFK